MEATTMALDRGMDKLWGIPKMELYSRLKRNELSSYEKACGSLK